MLYETKICRRCQKEKLKSEFNQNRKSKDGLQSYCRGCQADYIAEWDAGKGNREKRSKYVARCEAKTPGRKTANYVLRKAILAGIIVKPEWCEIDACEKPPIGHHEDYNKELEVMWLCRRHHRRRHEYLTKRGLAPIERIMDDELRQAYLDGRMTHDEARRAEAEDEIERLRSQVAALEKAVAWARSARKHLRLSITPAEIGALAVGLDKALRDLEGGD